MTKQKSTKKTLLTSVLSLVLCMAMLVGTTFAWFTDSVSSGNNIIKSGDLDVNLYYWDNSMPTGTNVSIQEQPDTKLFKNVDGEDILWEPGASGFGQFEVANEGSLALKYQLKLNFYNATETAPGSGKTLADVLSVYAVARNGNTGADAVMEDANLEKLRTNGMDSYVPGYEAQPLTNFVLQGYLLPGESFRYELGAFWEPAANDNDYNVAGGLSIDFGVSLVATQMTYEEDSYDDRYDADAPLNYAPVSNANELKIALVNKEENIVLTKNIETAGTFNVDYAANINGAGFTISRAEGFTGNVFTVKANAALTVENAIIDGGAVWTGTVDTDIQRGITNSGIAATGNLILAERNAQIILNEGAVLQNNAGAHAVNLGTRIGATLTLNGGWIINNSSDSGAIWGGGDITINEGSKINNNSSTGSAGAIRMVGKCNLTMNGGEISNNIAAADGGAIWGYGVNGNTSVYNLNGGKMENNTAGGVGGAIYTGTYSTINLSGDFEMCNNTAADSGAMRLTNYTILNMTGGKIYGNISTNNEDNNGFYGWCPRLTITGGELSDNITIAGGHTPTVGGDSITGVVNFNVGTNHNTINLAAEFGIIKFTVAEGENFNAFNFKPAAGYTYAEGDEANLICMNEGYRTYWDNETATFRLKNNQ